MTEDEGQANFKDVLDGQTVHEQVDENTGMSAQVIIESPDEKKQPRIEVRDEKGKIVRKYLLPSGAHLMVEDGQAVSAGDVLAKIPRETAKTKDITGGLPRVVELFEARRPKEPAVITEIDGSVKYGGVQKQYRKIFVTGDGETREYQLPRGSHINVQEGERVKAGEPLMDGPIDPHDILRVRDHTAVWTGTKMVVWGGFGGTPAGYLNSGGIYDPARNTWTATSTAGASTGRSNRCAGTGDGYTQPTDPSARRGEGGVSVARRSTRQGRGSSSAPNPKPPGLSGDRLHGVASLQVRSFSHLLGRNLEPRSGRIFRRSRGLP